MQGCAGNGKEDAVNSEKYKAKCPGFILMADPAYFEEDGKTRDEYDQIYYQPPPGFKMGILLEKIRDPSFFDGFFYMMSLYFAPEQYLDYYLDFGADFRYNCAQCFVDVANVRYRVAVDGRQHDIETGEEGEWGLYQEFYRYEENGHKPCAVHIGFMVPETEAFECMREMMYSLFEEVQPVQPDETGKHSDKKRQALCR